MKDCKGALANTGAVENMGGLIGARIPRLEDGALLVGKGRFVDDIALAGVWHATFVRSPHPHAAIRRVDAHAAMALPGVHAVLTLDKAGWHTTRKLEVPSNISPLHLPPASPELNPTEKIWQYLRQAYLSNRVFRDYDDVVELSSSAWNKLIAEPGRIASIGTGSWTISQRP